jgi:hypothetical protein
VARVGIGEEKVELARPQLALDGRALVRHLTLEVGVILGQLLQLDQVARAPLEAIPRGDQLAMLGSLTGQLTGSTWVVPRARLRELGV